MCLCASLPGRFGTLGVITATLECWLSVRAEENITRYSHTGPLYLCGLRFNLYRAKLLQLSFAIDTVDHVARSRILVLDRVHDAWRKCVDHELGLSSRMVVTQLLRQLGLLAKRGLILLRVIGSGELLLHVDNAKVIFGDVGNGTVHHLQVVV